MSEVLEELINKWLEQYEASALPATAAKRERGRNSKDAS
jgi:hypothetical protein